MQKAVAAPDKEVGLRRRVLVLAWPAVTEQLLNMLVGLVTAFLVGHLGASSLAAVGLGEQVMMFGTAFFSAIGAGSTAVIARHVGASEFHMVSRIVQQSFIIATAVGVTSSIIVMVFAETIFILLQAKPDVVEVGTVYLRIMSSSLFLSTMMFVAGAILRGAGDTRTPMQVMLGVNAINIVLSVILIDGVFGLPGFQVIGAGIATATSRNIGGIVMVLAVVKSKGFLKSSLFRGLRLDFVQMRRISRVGVPAGVETLQMSTAQMVFATIVSSLGTTALASHIVAMRIESISFMPGFGLGIATTTLVGQQLGAGRPDLARKCGYMAQRYAVAVMTSFGIILFLLSDQAVAFFVNDPDVIAQGSTLIKIMCFAQPAMATMNVLAGGLRGAGDTRWVMVIMTLGLWAGRVPFGFFFARILGIGVAGAWIAMVSDMFFRGGFCWWRFASGKWQRIVV